LSKTLTAYHPICLMVRDKTNRTLERSIRHVWELRKRPYSVAAKICKWRTKFYTVASQMIARSGCDLTA
jgi:hypothetical protein